MKAIRSFFLNGSMYGKLILLVGVLLTGPLWVLPFYPEEAIYAPAFLLPTGFSIVIGLIICALTQQRDDIVFEWESPLQRSSLPVLFVWIYGFAIGALPWMITGQLDLIQALFESVSGWTTTGMNILEVATLPKVFLFYRSFMQFCGGVGFVLMMVIVIQGKGSMSLYSAEGHIDRLMPSLRQTARFIFMIYSVFLVSGILLYCFFGMPLFDAVCHAMSAVSTAGYSTLSGGLGGYNSLPIEIVTVVLMLLGAANFAVLLFLTKGKLKQVFRSTELRMMLVMLVLFVPLIAITLAAGSDSGPGQGFRESLFGVVTVLSTTGYSTANYSAWPPFALGLLMILMVVGGSAGSTSGGIKLSRLYFIIRITRENIHKRVSPAIRTAVPTYNGVRGKIPIDDALIANTFGFIACYMCTLIIGTLLLTLTAGCPLFDAMFEFTSVLGTIGISNGLTTADMNSAALIVEMFGMALGRLEILVIFYGITSAIKTIKQVFRNHPQS